MRCPSRLRLFLCLTCFFCACAIPGARAAEEPSPSVLSFISEAELSTNGVLTVKESLKVWLPEGRFGIDRDIPFLPGEVFGKTDSSQPEIIELTIDGSKQDAKDVELPGKGLLRVHVRDIEKPLRQGEHTITVNYRTRGQVSRLKDRDELNWNVAGPNWQMPIAEAVYSLTMPDTVKDITSIVRFAGAVSPDDQVKKVQGDLKDGRTVAAFRANRPLAPGEAMTVSVSWPKGIIAPPPSTDSFQKRHEKEIGIALLAVLAAYFAFVWIKFREKKHDSTPRYKPPLAPATAASKEEEISAPAFGFVMDDGTVEPRTLTAALLDFTARGLCKIRGNRKNGFTVEAKDAPEPQSREGQALCGVLKKHGVIELNRREGNIAVQEMREALTRALTVSYPKAVRRYLEFIWGGVALALVCSGVTLWCVFGSPDLWPSGIMDFLMLAMFAFFMAGVLVSPFYWGLNLTGKLVLGIIAVVLLSLAYSKAEETFAIVPAWLFETTLIQVLLPLPFFLLLRGSSSMNEPLYAECDKFAFYLCAAENKSFANFNPPKRTAELYEKLLPYAVAVKGEKNWNRRCSPALSDLAPGKRVFGTFDELDDFILAADEAATPAPEKKTRDVKKKKK